MTAASAFPWGRSSGRRGQMIPGPWHDDGTMETFQTVKKERLLN